MAELEKYEAQQSEGIQKHLFIRGLQATTRIEFNKINADE
jgi:hypothetical protein